jgi:hypothetical protein
MDIEAEKAGIENVPGAKAERAMQEFLKGKKRG